MNLTPQVRVTETVHGDEALEGLLEGVKTLHDPVASTLGASGRTVIIEDLQGNPKPTKDGVTVAKAIVPLESVERMGNEIIKQASLNTANEAGDGTTTATGIPKEIIDRGLELMEKKSSNYTDFNAGMQAAVNEIVEKLNLDAQKVDLNSIQAVATISANNDAELGAKIAEAFQKAGEYGVVLMEKSQTNDTYVSTSEGFELESGYRSNVFVNVKESARVEYKNALVLLSTVKIERFSQIEPHVEYALSNSRPLVIVSEVDEDLVALLAYNVAKTKKLQAVVVNPSHFGVRRRDILSDLAVYTGATLIDEETGDNLDVIDFDALGLTAKVVIDKSKSIFLGRPDVEEFDVDIDADIKSHVGVLQLKLENEKIEHEKKFLEERIAKISSAVAVINVGANSQAEQSEIADRVDDAIHATRAALSEGIVAGGGIALHNMISSIGLVGEGKSEAFEDGFNTVILSAVSPLKQILKNGDIEYVEDNFTKHNWGQDVKTREFGDMVKMNIIDPVKVTKTALKNAVSAASTLLSTTSVVVNLRRA